MMMNLDNLKLISKKVFVEGVKVVTLTAGVKVYFKGGNNNEQETNV